MIRRFIVPFHIVRAAMLSIIFVDNWLVTELLSLLCACAYRKIRPIAFEFNLIALISLIYVAALYGSVIRVVGNFSFLLLVSFEGKKEGNNNNMTLFL